MFGLVHFAQKAGTGVGSLLAGIFLDIIKFPRGAPVASVDYRTVSPIAWFYVVTVLLMSANALP